MSNILSKGVNHFSTKFDFQSKLLKYEYLRHQPRYQEKLIKLNGKDFKVSDGPSFYYSFKEIFLEKIYKFNANTATPHIVDCGSNYGTSIVYFKTLFPNAIITGIEADPKVYNILKSNIDVRNYSDVVLLNNAVSTSPEPINFLSEGADSGRIIEGNQNSNSIKVNTIDLDQLLEKPVDFLKMDIEGAETEVITASKKLANVSQLFIEYHSFKDSPQTLNQLLSKLTEEGFRYYIHTQFCSPRPLTEDRLQLDMDLQLNIYAKKR